MSQWLTFPVYLNPDTSEQNQQDTWQADPIGENPLEELRDGPTRVYFMEEYIAGSWEKPLHPANTNHDIDDRSPAIMQLLSAFQHWIYMYTNGQMIITNIQGVVPLLSKPKIIDLNPEAHWSHWSPFEARDVMNQFLVRHTCSRAC
ncbi:hypothetical protein H4Q26_012655 [Puccinia striiformis f. sp. tritici PST-130]|nr:hypothetical protein H4Q26_012655 [Puccinia striiformis f. sp. tritici PST-130]